MIQSKATRLKVEALRLELMFSCHFGLYEGPKELTDAFNRQKIQVCNYSYSKESEFTGRETGGCKLLN